MDNGTMASRVSPEQIIRKMNEPTLTSENGAPSFQSLDKNGMNMAVENA
jgi:hypothetical protein